MNKKLAILLLIGAGLVGFAAGGSDSVNSVDKIKLNSYYLTDNNFNIFIIEYQNKKFIVNSRGGICQIQ